MGDGIADMQVTTGSIGRKAPRAEIVSYDFGRHNADFEKASSRIIEGGSWKKQRIIVMLPAAQTIPTKVALSHWNLIFPPNQPVYRMLCLGMEVGDAYSQAIEAVIAHPQLSEWEYVLTVEHDNVPAPDGVLKLLKRMDERPELSCISGLYWTKFEGGVPQIWGSPQQDPVINFRPQPPVPGDLVECYGTGMGFALWRLAMFKDKNIKRPLFVTKAGADGVGTQDLAFWGEARKWGYRCGVDCDVLVGHYDLSADVVW